MTDITKNFVVQFKEFIFPIFIIFHISTHYYSQKRVLLDEMEDELAKEDIRVGRTAAVKPDPLSQYKSVEDKPRSFEKDPIPSWVRTMLPIKNQQGGIVARYLAVDGKQ